jgi:hypothetical protein
MTRVRPDPMIAAYASGSGAPPESRAMLIWFVALYLLVSVGIGRHAVTRAHDSCDIVVAGRLLPLPVVAATVFTT